MAEEKPVTNISYKRSSHNAVNAVIPQNDWIHTYKGVYAVDLVLLNDLETAAQLTLIPQNYLATTAMFVSTL